MQIKFSCNDSYVIEDFYKGGYRLTIDAHAPSHAFTAPLIGERTIRFNGQFYSATLLLSHLKGLLPDFNKYRRIRVLACYSADGGGNSFVATLSRLIPYIEVKGYVGILTQLNFPSGDVYTHFLNGINIFQHMNAEPELEKDNAHFHSITWLNNKILRENDNSLKSQ